MGARQNVDMTFDRTNRLRIATIWTRASENEITNDDAFQVVPHIVKPLGADCIFGFRIGDQLADDPFLQSTARISTGLLARKVAARRVSSAELPLHLCRRMFNQAPLRSCPIGVRCVYPDCDGNKASFSSLLNA